MNNEIMKKTNSGKRLSPLKAIKSYCRHHCCVDDMESWKNCTLTNCFLYRYRLGQGNRAKKPKHSSGVHNSSKNKPSNSLHNQASASLEEPQIKGSLIQDKSVQERLK